MTHPLLEEIKARLNAATPGPWKAYDWPSFPRSDENCVRIESETTITAFCFSDKPNHDALLIAHAPEDLRKLIAVVEVLSATISKHCNCREYASGPNGMDTIQCDNCEALESAEKILGGKE
jgi:hypothetical protein